MEKKTLWYLFSDYYFICCLTMSYCGRGEGWSIITVITWNGIFCPSDSQKKTICPCHQDFLFEVWVERQFLLFVLGFFWWLSCFCHRFGCTCHTFMETSIQFLSMLKKITSGKKLHQWYSVYFKGYSKIQRTPSRDPKKKLAFWFWSSASISHQKFQQGQPCFNQVNHEDKPGCLG